MSHSRSARLVPAIAVGLLSLATVAGVAQSVALRRRPDPGSVRGSSAPRPDVHPVTTSRRPRVIVVYALLIATLAFLSTAGMLLVFGNPWAALATATIGVAAVLVMVAVLPYDTL